MKFSKLTDKHVVWCDTEEKAETLCKFMDSLGLKFRSGSSYLANVWWFYKKKTYYNPIKRTYGNKEWAENDYIIIPYDDLELDGMFGQVTSKKSKIDIHKEICSESNDETLLDLANYAIMELMERRK